MAVDIVTGTLWELTHNGTPANKPIQDYGTTLTARLEELFPNGHPLVPVRAAKP
jgi:hypothetical protein